MPDGVQPDIDYSNGLVGRAEHSATTRSIFTAASSGILRRDGAAWASTPSRQTKVNLPSRIRMATLYAIAQSVGGRHRHQHLATSPRTGSATARSTATAPGAFSPLGMYTTEEVIALGAESWVCPSASSSRPPSDGLTGKTDEDNLGFTYHAVNEYIRQGVGRPRHQGADRPQAQGVSRFKFQTLPVYHNGLPMALTDETDYDK